MLSKLININRSAAFWGFLIISCLALELSALYYQYVLDYYPCVLCVHVRAWVLAIMLAAILGLWLRRSRFGLPIANVLVLGAAGGMLERSYITLGTERGTVEGSCGNLQAGFPSWLPLDQWLPAVFKPLESCGLTPWLIQEQLSMAEGLVLIAAGIMVLMAVMLLGSLYAAIAGR